MAKIITTQLPHDLPENWNGDQYVSPGGKEVGLTEQHGYNYLMKQVNNVQKAANELDVHASVAFHRNLLHNWYFKNPVDLKQGFIVPAGVSYYSDTALATRVGATSKYLKATRVNATYSSIQINSVTYYVPSNSTIRGYVHSNNKAIDRWNLDGGFGESQLLIGSDGITLNFGAASGLLLQEVGAMSSAHYEGRTYTLTAHIVSVTGSGEPELYVSTGDETFMFPIADLGYTSYTFTVPIGASEFAVGIRNRDSSPVSVKVSAMKLEAGTVSTLENDPPADYAEQVCICAQFDSTTGSYKGFTNLATTNIFADATVTE